MTTVTQIIYDAFRQSNLLAITAQPTAAQSTEALRYLNRLVKSVFGNEAGDQLTGFPIGRVGYERPAGYPWYDLVPDNDWFVPENTRLMVNIDQPLAVYLHPNPDDGCRVAVTAANTDLTENYIVLYGNGRLIESQPIALVATDIELFYRADLASWQRYAPLVDADLFPFPEEFDDFFITMLALRLNPSYGATMDPQSQEVLRRSKSQLQSRYTQNEPQRSELALIRPSKLAADRDQWGTMYSMYNPNSMFNKGWPY